MSFKMNEADIEKYINWKKPEVPKNLDAAPIAAMKTSDRLHTELSVWKWSNIILIKMLIFLRHAERGDNEFPNEHS